MQEQVSGGSLVRAPNIRAWPEFCSHEWGTPSDDVSAGLEDLVRQLEKLEPQWALQKSLYGRNIWMIKPGTNSKGSGVECMTTLPEILRHCDTMPNRIIQRYIERPLLLFGGRNFDIRQWVLVRSIMPLRIFIFSDCYLRLCNEAYDLNDLRNRERHISNWQVNKHGKNVTNGAVASLAEFKEELRSITGSHTSWEDKLRPQLCKIVVQTMRAAEKKLTPRPENFELYGFDLMVDESLNIWLLEVNLSPSCEARTPHLDSMISRMVKRLVDVAVLGQEVPDGQLPDWQKICDDAEEHDKGASMRCAEVARWTPRDLDFTLHGQALQLPRRCRRDAGNKSSVASAKQEEVRLTSLVC
jgi:hypothetical protein